MKIKICTKEFLEYYKTNFEEFLPLYLNKDIDNLNELFSDKNIYEGSIEFEYVPLLLNDAHGKNDRENIKILYNSLKHLTPVQATYESLWVAMINTIYRDYLFNFIDDVKNKKNASRSIKNSILFSYGIRRSCIVQKLSLLWWIGYFTYDDTNTEDPFELTDFYAQRDIQGKTTAFFSSKFNSNKDLALGIISGIKEMTEKGIIENKREHYVTAAKYFNIIGGIKILDTMTREEIKNITIQKITEDILQI